MFVIVRKYPRSDSYNGDGMGDLLWRDTDGNTAMWFMNGAAVSSTAVIGNIPTTWTVQSTNAQPGQERGLRGFATHPPAARSLTRC
jgi:hypothetical protein